MFEPCLSLVLHGIGHLSDTRRIVMKRNEYKGMCQLFEDGEMIWVENRTSHLQGRVTGCHDNMIDVDVKGHRETWDSDICRELTHGFKVNYDETMKHPHEYDTHLD